MRVLLAFIVAASVNLSAQDFGSLVQGFGPPAQDIGPPAQDPEQAPRPGPGQGPGPRQGLGRGNVPQDGPDMSPVEIQKIFDGYLLVQIQEALGLTDQLFAQIVPRVRTLQEIRRRYPMERGRLINELQRLSRPNLQKIDDAMLKERLTALQEHDARFAADLRKAYNAIDELLDVRQQARFRVFEEGLERKKFDLLLRARQPGRQMPPPQ